MPSRMALQASKLYSNNAVKFLLALGDAKDEVVINMEDEVIFFPFSVRMINLFLP